VSKGPPRTRAWPLRIYYDARCPLCERELGALSRNDVHARLVLVDCSGADFEDADATRAGLGAALMMRRIHARDADGRWLVGIDVFEAAYRAVGLERIARAWGHPVLRPLWRRHYPWVADHRMRLSRLGLDRPLGWLVERIARRAAARACTPGVACVEGACATPAAASHAPPARGAVQ
jgi:predicted DCC family thiol-disulfide oxidoreductase YuxK